MEVGSKIEADHDDETDHDADEKPDKPSSPDSYREEATRGWSAGKTRMGNRLRVPAIPDHDKVDRTEYEGSRT